MTTVIDTLSTLAGLDPVTVYWALGVLAIVASVLAPR